MSERADILGAATSTNTPVLEARGLELSWNGIAIAHDISLSLGSGEIACVLGRSGCGKSTLFHALAGLTKPDAGRVLLEGEDVTGEPGNVSYMLQKDLLLPGRTVLDNCALPLILRDEPIQAARERVRSELARFGLEGSEDLWPAQLSGGMRQRAALLRTYLMDKHVILLDEPFSALDAITRTELRSWFCEMVDNLGLSALLITHDVDEAIVMADTVHVMVGAPTRTGKPSELVGSVTILRDGDSGYRRGDSDFELTDAFREAKLELSGLLA